MTRDRYEVEEIAYEIVRTLHYVAFLQKNKVSETIKSVCKKLDATWDVASTDGTTLLHTFAMYDQMSAIHSLVQMSADVKTADHDGNTILHHAFNVEGGLNMDTSFIVINWALDNGFNINQLNHLGQTPLFLLADHFKECDANDTEQEIVVQFVEMFESCGGNIYHRDHQGRTFLDVLPVANEDWMVLDGALDPWRIKMQRHKLNEEVNLVSHPHPKGEKYDTI